MCVCVSMSVCACVRACVSSCARACVSVGRKGGGGNVLARTTVLY